MNVASHRWVWTLVIEQCVYVKFKYVYTRGGDSFPKFYGIGENIQFPGTREIM